MQFVKQLNITNLSLYMINNLSNYKPSPEIRLWQGVIIQAIQDATNKRNSSWINKHEINQAILWFERNGKRF